MKARRAPGKGGKFSAHERAQVRDVRAEIFIDFGSGNYAPQNEAIPMYTPCHRGNLSVWTSERRERADKFRQEMHARCCRSSRKHTFQPACKNTIGRSGFFIQNVRNHSYSLSFICVFCNRIGVNSSFFESDIKILRYNRGIDWNFFRNDIARLRIYNRIFIFHIEF